MGSKARRTAERQLKKLLKRFPAEPAVLATQAAVLRHDGKSQRAIEAYGRAIDAGLQDAAPAYNAIGMLESDLHHTGRARHAFTNALARSPDFTAARYNLALLEEEAGNWSAAEEAFERVLATDPSQTEALARLAQGRKLESVDGPLLQRLQSAISAGLAADSRESLHFALAKALDDVGEFEAAAEHYTTANGLAARRVGRYDRRARERQNDALISTCSSAWLSNFRGESSSAPVFICGMFRSGSTLLEQMLAAHPAFEAGGELEYFGDGDEAAERTAALSAKRANRERKDYLSALARLAPDKRVTNKRPVNYRYLGYLRAVFPDARFIHITRAPLDNCLSVYFQQLNDRFAYANEIGDIAHYYASYRALMAHWREIMPGSICEVRYEELVQDPASVLPPIFDFLGEEFDAACLRFFEVPNRVRTASVWQVRQPLHGNSTERWRNYPDIARRIREALPEPLRGSA